MRDASAGGNDPPQAALASAESPLRRATARVLPVDPLGRVLLLHGWDPHHPNQPFWFTIGGAAEGGESLREAAARELYEETHISVDPAQLGEPIAENTIEFSWGGRRIVQDQTFYAILVESAEVSLDGLTSGSRPPPTSTAGSPPATWAPTSAPHIPTSPS